MRTRLLTFAALGTVAVFGLTACAGSGADTASGEPAIDGTFNLAVEADPGNLHPLMTANSSTHRMGLLNFDSLVYVDPATSEIGPWLAEEWDETPTSATFTIRDGVVCSDGSALTAQTVADNISFVVNPDNQSALRGVYVPADATASAEGQIVTVETPAASPFLLRNLARLPIVCDASIEDPEAASKQPVGSGLFALEEAVANDHYTYTRRDGYTWGPDDTTSETPGVPKTVDVKIVTNESTAANQLLSGELNAAEVVGADRDRLTAGGLESAVTKTIAGEMWFNHGADRPTSDVAVRTALVQALNLEDLANVITGGNGGPSAGIVSSEPRACSVDVITGALPQFDLKAAQATLQDAGWAKNAKGIYEKAGQPLELKFFYDSMGDTYDAAADVALQAWTELGASVEVTSGDGNKAVEVLLSGTNNSGWDIGWEPLYVNLPSMLVPFFSGDVPAAGMNFSQIENADYEAAVAKATGLTGDAACEAWGDAEAALYEQVSVVPFADTEKPLFLKNAGLAYGTKTNGSALRLFQ